MVTGDRSATVPDFHRIPCVSLQTVAGLLGTPGSSVKRPQSQPHLRGAPVLIGPGIWILHRNHGRILVIQYFQFSAPTPTQDALRNPPRRVFLFA